MMAHPATVRNIDRLRADGVHIIEPAEGELASHLVGKGRMEEPEGIFRVLEDYFAAGQDLSGKTVLITAGPTYERIDPVRFIGNYSSGKMGYALADEAAARGARVVVVSGPVAVRAENPSVEVRHVESACEMLAECEKVFPEADIAIMAAAVADYAPVETAASKIKRERDEVPVIHLKKNPDIAATLGQAKRSDQMLVGFALETDHELDNAADKLRRKNLDMIVLNSLRDAGAGFGTDTNKITILRPGGLRTEYPLKSKKEVARDILDNITGKSPLV